jgi:aspartyl-tRNA(Asn)/glutamyl-tRNA(Gln) amidotransferase subunit C
MAKVSPETVDDVARLAHLSLTREERETFARQLDEILSYAESIQALDTTDVPPMSHPQAGASLREDVAVAGLARDPILASAPDASEGLFRVPRVLGG